MSRLEALMGLLKSDPNDADLYFMIASEHASAGRHAEAIAMLDEYVQRGRDVGAGWALMADCLEAMGDEVAMRSALENGIAAARRGGHPTLAAELAERLAGE